MGYKTVKKNKLNLRLFITVSRVQPYKHIN